MLRVLRIVIGIFLVIFGLFALVTPLTPGAWLGFIGLEMLGFGFLIPKKLRDLWEQSSAKLWINRKLIACGCPPLELRPLLRVLPRGSKDIQPRVSPPAG